LNREGTAQNPPPPPVYYYEDSFGNILQANPYAVSAGVYPPSPSVPTPNAPTIPQSVKEPHGDGKIHEMEEHPIHVRPLDGGGGGGCTAGSSGTYYNCGYPYYNILLIMVDQMRSPLFWPPSGSSGGLSGQQNLFNATPYISGLMNQSYVYQNYFTCANHCSPARSTFLTGLYTQQTSMYKTQNPAKPGGNDNLSPSLLPYYVPSSGTWTSGDPAGFPTIGNVLSQILNIGDGTGTPATGQYDCAWIGKWHVSCLSGQPTDTTPGADGPVDYGFSNEWNIPTRSTQYPMAAGASPSPSPGGFPSPNGMLCEGNGGDFLDSLQASATQSGVGGARNVPNWLASNSNLSLYSNYVQLNDSAIASAFVNYWLPNEPANTPGNRWFCAVSFVNPHDIATFPWAFGVVGDAGSLICDTNSMPTPSYCTANSADVQTAGYQAPPPATTTGGPPPPPVTYSGQASCTGHPWCSYDQTQIASFNNLYTATPSNNAPTGWNNAVPGDDPILNPYGYNSGTYGKPGYQSYFETQLAGGTGIMNNQAAWLQFLNYYIWLEASVDQQVNNVLFNLAHSAQGFDSNTIIIFASDHGEYAGSHNLHDKGGGVYDEGINPLFFVSFPGQRGLVDGHSAQANPVWVPYCCSSVDVLPFIYRLALGNDSWRTDSGSMISYLAGREAMMDALLYGGPGPVPQRRLSGIPLYSLPSGYGYPNQTQPYILSTCDEDSKASVSGIGYQPSHVIAFRTVDVTDSYANLNYSGANMYGGGKLGIYSYWDTCGAPDAPVFMPINAGLTGAAASQYEFYNYSKHPPAGSLNANPGETGNQAFDPSYESTLTFLPEASAYQTAFLSSAVQDELYYPNFPTTGNSAQLTTAVQNAFCLYWLYLQASSLLTGSDGNPGSCRVTCPPNCTTMCSS